LQLFRSQLNHVELDWDQAVYDQKVLFVGFNVTQMLAANGSNQISVGGVSACGEREKGGA
jgi:hypothetical protein